MLQLYYDSTLKSAKWNGYLVSDKTILLATVTTPILRIPVKTNATFPLVNGGKPLNLVVVNIGGVSEWTFVIYDDNMEHAVQAIKDFILSVRLMHAATLKDIKIVSKNTLKGVQSNVS